MNARPLPGGNILIAAYAEQKIVEVNREKEIVWEHTIDGKAIDAQRLENGNTMLGIADGTVQEITPEGKVVWKHSRRTDPRFQPLPNGNVLLVTAQGKVIEITRKAKVVWNTATAIRSRPSACPTETR